MQQLGVYTLNNIEAKKLKPKKLQPQMKPKPSAKRDLSLQHVYSKFWPEVTCHDTSPAQIQRFLLVICFGMHSNNN